MVKASSDHTRLMRVLGKMVKQQKWQRMAKLKGKVTLLSTTKSRSIKMTVGDTVVYALKKNKNLFTVAEKIRQKDVVSVTARRYLGKLYCTKLTNYGKTQKMVKTNKKITQTVLKVGYG